MSAASIAASSPAALPSSRRTTASDSGTAGSFGAACCAACSHCCASCSCPALYACTPRLKSACGCRGSRARTWRHNCSASRQRPCWAAAPAACASDWTASLNEDLPGGNGADSTARPAAPSARGGLRLHVEGDGEARVRVVERRRAVPEIRREQRQLAGLGAQHAARRQVEAELLRRLPDLQVTRLPARR